MARVIASEAACKRIAELLIISGESDKRDLMREATRRPGT